MNSSLSVEHKPKEMQRDQTHPHKPTVPVARRQGAGKSMLLADQDERTSAAQSDHDPHGCPPRPD